MQVVPFTPDYDQRFTVQLGEDKYTLDTRWNERGKVWTTDITRDSDQVLLIAGVPLLAGAFLLAPYALGIGDLMLFDMTLTDSDPGPDNFGEDNIVVWFTNDEVAAVAAAQRAGGLPVTATTSVIPPAGRSAPAPGTPGSTTPATPTTNNITITQTSNVTNITGGGLGFSKEFESLTDDSGDEVLIGQYVQLPNLNVNPTVALEVGIYADGAGSLRVYYGTSPSTIGATGTPSGTLATTATAVSGPAIYQISATPANPGTPVFVKVTMQSSAPATSIAVNNINGFMG